ncbi:MAG: dihydroneopterin aldolase [Verrucomicrobiales bacterium]|jgi:FolB domain-containing protein|nr:dihydroneopterin aldolase [Verrucomicrobiales bacterium]
MTSDQIHIDRLTVSARLGVTDEERAQPQRLEVSLTLTPPSLAAAAATDDLALTVDYFQVCETVKHSAGARPRRLLETLAADLCAVILTEFKVSAVTVEVRKFIIPTTRFVSVTMTRHR